MNKNSNNNLFIRKFLLYAAISFFLLSLAAIYLSAHFDDRDEGVLQLHGWVEGTNVTLSAKVAGQLKEVSVEEGDQVVIGQPVFRIDSRQIKAQLSRAKADVERAIRSEDKAMNDLAVLKSSLEGARISLKLAKKKSAAIIAQSESTVLSAKAQLVEAQVLFSRAEKDYIRSRPLVKKRDLSQRAFDAIEEAYLSRKAMVDRASREVELSEAGKRLALTTVAEIELKKNSVSTLERQVIAGETAVAIAKAELAAANADKDRIEEDLVDSSEFSPISGTVIDKIAEAGEYVVKGSPVVVVVDLQKLYIKTYVEQTLVGKIKVGDIAEIKIDSFPDRSFVGEVYFIASQAEFTPRNIQMDEHRSTMVYKIKVRINNPEGLVKPGLPADVKINLAREAP
jgi:HlyD family secretion protein